MYAVIRTGGKQYLVRENDRVKVETISQSARTTKGVVFSDVLLVVDEKGDVAIGKPTVAGAQVRGEVIADGKAKKIRVVKYKPKVRYRRVTGHRQAFTEIRITGISTK